jgi:tRNA A-37 threonylcarbamoyl transferase component Bud32
MSDQTGGTRTIGRYRVLEELGRGAMGVVYRGFDPVIGRKVALKTIAFGVMDEDAQEFRRRLYREASAAGALTHPNIVIIYDVIEDGPTTAVAMEFVEGRTLGSILEERAPLPLAEALQLFDEICAALDYAGAKGVIHRDIKPANILVAHDGRPKVADFGLARLLTSNMTQAGVVLGSPSYMSPEQVQGIRLDRRSDLFSATTMFYEMVARKRPFDAGSVVATMEQIVRGKPKPAHEMNPALSPAISRVFERALAKNPDERYDTGAALMVALRAAAREIPKKAVAAAPAEETEAQTVMVKMSAATARPAEAETALFAPGAAGSRPAGAEKPAAEMEIPLARSVAIPTPAPDIALRSHATDSPAAAPADMDLRRTETDAQPAPDVAIIAPAPSERAEEAERGSAERRPASRRLGLLVGIAGVLVVVIVVVGMLLRGRFTAETASGQQDANQATPGATSEPVPGPGSVPGAAPKGTGRAGATVKGGGEQPSGAAGAPGAARASGAPPPADVPSAPAVLDVQFAGQPFPLLIQAGDRRLGPLAGNGRLDVQPGAKRVRAIAESVFLARDFGVMTLKAGGETRLAIPDVGSAVVTIKGEVYTGVQILVDNHPLAGPYPAQIPKIVAGSHTVRFTWASGPFEGKDLKESFEVVAGGHFLIRAVPENEQVTVQQVR